MKRKRSWLLFVLAAMIAASGFFLTPAAVFTKALPQQAAKHKGNFRKSGKKWKIDKIQAKKGEEVSWSAVESDLYFQFMDSTLFGEYTYTLKKPNTLTLVVKGAKGTYPYAIFRTADSTYVTGNSPPTVIIGD